jgi:hypothetical protein
LIDAKNGGAYTKRGFVDDCHGTNLTLLQQQHVQKSIPIDAKTGKYILMNYQRRFDSTMGLCSIQNGFSDLQIRLSYEFARNDTFQYIVFTKDGANYSAQFYKVLFKLNEKRDSIVSVVKSVIQKEPSSSWKSFIAKLMSLQIMTLPDYSGINNYPMSMDANFLTIQIATDKIYRIYSYLGPESAQMTNGQAELIMQILKLIEKEFSVKWLYQN